MISTAPSPKAREHAETSAPNAARPLQRMIHSGTFRIAITILIFVNAIVIGLQTSDAIKANYGTVLHLIDRIILAIFVAEIALRLFADRRDALSSGWFWFDVIVVAVALLPLPGNLSVIRTLRVLRVLRLLSVSEKMRRVVAGLLNAVPGMATVMGVLAIVFYVFAVFATETFGAGEDPHGREFFGTLGDSLFTLFQVMTLEDWSGVARPLMEIYPWAWLFFVLFVIVTAFAVLNLFIGIIVDAMQDDRDEALQGFRHEEEMNQQVRFDRLLAEIHALRQDVAELKAGRAAIAPRSSPPPE